MEGISQPSLSTRTERGMSSAGSASRFRQAALRRQALAGVSVLFQLLGAASMRFLFFCRMVFVF